MTALALLAIAAAMVLIRIGWAGRRGASVAGWVLASAALAWLTWRDGAWGLSVGTVAGSFTALALVAQAGVVSPGRRTARTPMPSRALAAKRPAAIGRRLAVFLAVVPLSFAAAQWLALAVNMAMRGGAALDANSVATMLLVQPVAWTVLMAWQMTLAGPREMFVPPVLAAVLGGLIWLTA